VAQADRACSTPWRTTPSPAGRAALKASDGPLYPLSHHEMQQLLVELEVRQRQLRESIKAENVRAAEIRAGIRETAAAFIDFLDTIECGCGRPRAGRRRARPSASNL